MRYIGIDPGERRLGVAVSDPDGRMAMPAEVIEESDPNSQIGAILAATARYGAEAIVVGMPYTLRGEVGPAAERVQAQVERLRQKTELPVYTSDERFSSGIAQSVLRQAEAGPQTRRRNVDKLAASIMLQSFLDRRADSAAPNT